MEPAARVELAPPLYKSGDTTINLHRREALLIRTETESGLGRFPLPIGIVLQVGGDNGIRTHTTQILSLLTLPNWSTSTYNSSFVVGACY